MTIEETIQNEAKEIIESALKKIESEESYKDMDGNILKSVFIGTCFNIMPSGKYYMPFACSNVEKCSKCDGIGEITNPNADMALYEEYYDKKIECPVCHGLGSEEAYKDQVMQEALEDFAGKYGAFVHSGEGDPCDMFVSIVVDEDEDMEMEEWKSI